MIWRTWIPELHRSPLLGMQPTSRSWMIAGALAFMNHPSHITYPPPFDGLVWRERAVQNDNILQNDTIQYILIRHTASSSSERNSLHGARTYRGQHKRRRHPDLAHAVFLLFPAPPLYRLPRNNNSRDRDKTTTTASATLFIFVYFEVLKLSYQRPFTFFWMWCPVVHIYHHTSGFACASHSSK